MVDGLTSTLEMPCWWQLVGGTRWSKSGIQWESGEEEGEEPGGVSVGVPRYFIVWG